MIADYPTSLNYLAPAFEHLLAQGNAWDSDTDTTVLQELLTARIEGQSPARAQAILDNDRATITAWLEETKDVDSPGHFIIEYLSIPNLANLLFKAARGEDPNVPDEAAEESLSPVPVSMETPPGFERIPAEEELFMRKGRQILTISRANHDLFELLPALWREAGKDEGDELEMAIADVSFGPNRGFRGVNKLGYCYILRVAGGFVQISLEKNDELVDIKSVESVFGTIRLNEE